VRGRAALAAGLLAALAAGTGAAAGQTLPSDAASGKPLPPFVLPDLEGRSVGPPTFEGRSPVLVVFITASIS